MPNQSRVIIEGVTPQIEGGKHPIHCVEDQIISVEANVLSDGHDVIAASLRYKHEKARQWKEVRMKALHNDRWTASFTV